MKQISLLQSFHGDEYKECNQPPQAFSLKNMDRKLIKAMRENGQYKDMNHIIMAASNGWPAPLLARRHMNYDCTIFYCYGYIRNTELQIQHQNGASASYGQNKLFRTAGTAHSRVHHPPPDYLYRSQNRIWKSPNRQNASVDMLSNLHEAPGYGLLR